MQGFVQLLAKLRAFLRADSRNSLRSTATTGFALLPSKQSVDGSNPSGGVNHTKGSGLSPRTLFIEIVQNSCNQVGACKAEQTLLAPPVH